MICPKCGAENADDSKFCEGCGTPLEVKVPTPEAKVEETVETVTEAVEEKVDEAKAAVENTAEAVKEAVPVVPSEPKGADTPKKGIDPKIVVGAIAAIAVIALIVVLINAIGSLGSGSGSGYKDYYVTFADEEDEKTYIVNGNKTIMEVNGGAYLYSGDGVSLDRSVQIMEDEEGAAYVVTAKKATKFASDISEAWLSDNGAFIVYLNEDDELKYYTVSSGKEVKIEDEISSSVVAMSPDGKSVLYVAKNDDDEAVMYLFNGKESTKIGSGINPITVSNGAKYIYAYNLEDEKIVVYNAKGEKKAAIGSAVSSKFVVNKDHTDVLYADRSDDGDYKVYLTSKGGEKVKIASDTSMVYPLVADDVAVRSVSTVGTVSIYGISSFKNILISTGRSSGTVYYLNGKYETSGKVSDTVMAVTADGANVIYVKENDDKYNLYTKNVKKDGEQVKVASDIQNLAYLSDGKTMFYVNNDDQLVKYSGGKETVIKGADDIDDLTVTGDDVVLFTSDDALFYVSGSGKKSLASEIYGSVSVLPTGEAYYRVGDEDSYDVYYSAGGKSFKVFLKGLSD